MKFVISYSFFFFNHCNLTSKYLEQDNLTKPWEKKKSYVFRASTSFRDGKKEMTEMF